MLGLLYPLPSPPLSPLMCLYLPILSMVGLLLPPPSRPPSHPLCLCRRQILRMWGLLLLPPSPLLPPPLPPPLTPRLLALSLVGPRLPPLSRLRLILSMGLLLPPPPRLPSHPCPRRRVTVSMDLL